jgi:hypothetical protein
MLLYVAFGEVMIKGNKRGFHKLSRNLSLGAMGIALIAYLLAALIFIGV